MKNLLKSIIENHDKSYRTNAWKIVILSCMLLLVLCSCIKKKEKITIWNQLHMAGGYDGVLNHWGLPTATESTEAFDILVYPGYTFRFSKQDENGIGHGTINVTVTDPNFVFDIGGFAVGSHKSEIMDFAKRHTVSSDGDELTIVTDSYWYSFQFHEDIVTHITYFLGP